jgi:hypothetical protein
MATRKVRLGITVGLPDPGASIPEVRDAEGRVIRASSTGVKYMPPGELVELEADEADRLESRWPYRPVILQDPDAIPVKRAR